MFYESFRLKLLYSLAFIAIGTFVYFVLNQNGLIDSWLNLWQYQVLKITGISVLIYIWLASSVVFDEMMQVVTIKSWHRKILPAKQIYYPDIKNIKLKRHGHIDENGDETNKGYFHLQLNNGDTYLLMVFKHKASIENARKRLVKHTKLKVDSI